VAVYKRLQVPQEDWRKPSGQIIAFAHSLIVPAGKYVGQPLRLRPFQLEFIRDVYNPRLRGHRRRKTAVLSIGRRGGKTLTAAVLVLAHLAGPLKKMNSTIISAATTRDQASLVFRYVADIIRLNKALKSRLKIVESVKRIVHKNDFSVYRAISADAGGSFGQGIDLVIYDELAQAKTRALYDSLMTSMGSQVEPLMVVISTQAPADTHILSELIDYGLKIEAGEFKDDSFTVHLYTAPQDCDLLDEGAWYEANPTLGDFRDLTEFRETMRRAVKVPSLEASIRNLYLNQRVQAKAPFMTPNVWKLNAGEVREELFQDGRPVFGGLDLSARVDLSAIVWGVEDDDGNVHMKCRVWTPEETMHERAARDRAPYPAWAKEDFIIPVPGPFPRVGRIAYDRWRINILKQSFDRMGIMGLPLVQWGQGFKDMSPAIDEFEQLAVKGKLRHGNHPVLRWCISNAVVVKDAAENRKLDKSKAFGRIDVAQAAVMMVGAMKCNTDVMVDFNAMIG
jgi:phage terminase large subunit-like protein